MDLMSPGGTNEDDDGVEEDEEDEEEGGGGWITPSNIKQIQMNAGERQPSGNVAVGCVTTDFAMQVSNEFPEYIIYVLKEQTVACW